MDITNTTYRERAEIIIRKLVEHTINHPNVIGFQIDNETKHYNTFSDEIQTKFVKYLKDKFGSCENLNKTFGLAYWSNSIHSWEDFPKMQNCINGGLASEFATFQRTQAAQFLIWQSNIVREYKKDSQFITHNFDFDWKKFGADIAQDGYSYGVQSGINHYEAVSSVTIAGTDIYHFTQDKLTGAEIAYGGDSIRSLKNDNYLILEAQAQAFKYWTPYEKQLRLHAFSHLASGADSVVYWNWYSIHNGFETYWKGILSHDMESNPVYEEICTIGRDFKKYSDILVNLKKDNKVCLVVDNKSMSAFEWFPIDKDLSYNDVVRWVYDSLYELNIECDIVDINALDTSKYKMIVTPALYCISEKNINKLKDFVNAGGTLFSTFKSFVANENMSVYHSKQPHILNECFGMTYNQFTEPTNLKIEGHEVTYFAELINPVDCEYKNYEHKYWGKYVGITKNKYGKGEAYYMGCFANKDLLKRYLLEATTELDLKIPNLTYPLIVRKGINNNNEIINYIFNYSCENQKVIMEFDAVDLFSGVKYLKGDKIILEDWDFKILIH